ncbi:MAG: hypothetical protein U9N31_06805, partial [Candidatus Marinimicrobia bacterium]|nr:hypothetical protein [Candidatus Neomarinimicrobiota bacterium]
MKRKLLSILLILTQFSILSADTLTFNNGVTIEGKLVKYDEDYLIFKVDEESMKDIPNEAVIYIKGVILGENQVVFNNKFVKNVEGRDFRLTPWRLGKDNIPRTGFSGQEVPTINPAEERRDKSMKRLNTLVFVICVVPIIVLIITLKT